MSLHGVAPDRVYIVLGVLLEIIFVGAADLLPQLCTLKILKYIKYSCDYQSLICAKISRCPPKNFLGEVPNPCLHGPGALLPHLFTLAGRQMPSAVYLCCTCPGVTPGGRYPLSLPCEARTFLTWGLSASSRGCPTWLRTILYCKQPGLSNPLANSFLCGYTIRRYEIQDTRYPDPVSGMIILDW